jgi:hypothetical protein
VLNSPSELKGGTFELSIKFGIDNVKRSVDLNQLIPYQYNVAINFYKVDFSGIITHLGTAHIPLNRSNLGLNEYDFTIDIDDLDLDQTPFAESITYGYGNDLFITVGTELKDCKVNAPQIKAEFVQQINDAYLKLKVDNLGQIFNNSLVENTYIEIYQDDIKLERISDANYIFTEEFLDYNFRFEISELRAESRPLQEELDYSFDPSLKTITLIGNYSNYHGLLFADIVYQAFNWDSHYISTLTPLTFTFEADYAEL